MSIRDDVINGFRSLRKSPGFLAVTLLTLGLSIGVNTVVFSVVNAVLLKPLDLPQPEQLVFLNPELRNRQVAYFPVSPVDWRDLNEEMDLLNGLAGIFTIDNALSGTEGRAEQVVSAGVTHNYFSVVGATPMLGRAFNEQDGVFSNEGVPENTPFPQNTFAPASVAIIDYDLWQRRYGGDPEIIDQQIVVGGTSMTVVGVMPEGFRVPMPPETSIESEPSVWMPLRVDFVRSPRTNAFMHVIARMGTGVTLAQVQDQINGYERRVKSQHEIYRSVDWVVSVRGLHEAITAQVQKPIWVLMAAVVFVLLIACANVANLMLVRASSRSREIAIRAALGSNHRDLRRFMLIEAGLLAFGGAILGLILSLGGLQLIDTIGREFLPNVGELGLDVNVLLFTFGMAFIATMGAALLPAMNASKPNIINQLRQRSSSSKGSGSGLFRDSMVVGEVALSYLLLVGTALMVLSFIELQRAEPGFEADGVLSFSLNLPNDKYPLLADQTDFLDRFHDRLEGLPGVESTGVVSPLPLSGAARSGRYTTEEAAANQDAFRQANYYTVKGNFFQTMQTKLLGGRLLDRNDEQSARAVVVINETLAQQTFQDADPIGKKLMIRLQAPEPVLVEVVGLVSNQVQQELQETVREAIYMTPEFSQFAFNLSWTVRSSLEPMDLVGPIKDLVNEMDRDVHVMDIQPMSHYVEAVQALTRFTLTLIGVFSVVALVLAAVGLYSVLAYVVRLRRTEIGVRMAFGTTPRKIFQLVVGRAMLLAIVGIVIGAIVAIFVIPYMQSMLINVSSANIAAYIAVVVLLLFVTYLAAFIPALRATSIDPAISLRGE